MQDFIKYYFNRYFPSHEVTFLLIWLLSLVCIIILAGGILAPVLVALVFAYLMQGIVNWLMNKSLSHKISVYIVFFLFLTILMTGILFIIPVLIKQFSNLIGTLPRMLNQVDEIIALLPEKYPFLSENTVSDIIHIINKELTDFGQYYIAKSYSKIVQIFSILIYCVLVPILIFFFLKDKYTLLSWLESILPQKKRLILQVASEMNSQIANYMRGKGIEIVITGVFTYVVFLFFGLHYAELLAILVGLSALVPFVGILVVSVPVFLVAAFQWGVSEQLLALAISYAVIQILDGNVLVPILFSDAVGLHPVAIIISVLIFGGIWGTTGIFFAIPLATLLKSVINAWPVKTR